MEFTSEINGKTALIYESNDVNEHPLLLMFCFSLNEAEEIVSRLRDVSGICFVAIVLEHWEASMIPWASKAVKATPKAEKLSEEIPALLDEVARLCKRTFRKRYLLGYSLGGLFAVFESAHGRFDGFASISGSMWYPDLMQYVQKSDYPGVTKAYFSIGDREGGKPSSPFFEVREKTQAIASAFKAKGISTTFELNEGNHFAQAPLRVRKAVEWLIAKEMTEQSPIL